MEPLLLTLNAGSSSIKLGLFRLGGDGPAFSVSSRGSIAAGLQCGY